MAAVETWVWATNEWRLRGRQTTVGAVLNVVALTGLYLEGDDEEGGRRNWEGQLKGHRNRHLRQLVDRCLLMWLRRNGPLHPYAQTGGPCSVLADVRLEASKPGPLVQGGKQWKYPQVQFRCSPEAKLDSALSTYIPKEGGYVTCGRCSLWATRSG